MPVKQTSLNGSNAGNRGRVKPMYSEQIFRIKLYSVFSQKSVILVQKRHRLVKFFLVFYVVDNHLFIPDVVGINGPYLFCYTSKYRNLLSVIFSF